jgi:hypothetical protein
MLAEVRLVITTKEARVTIRHGDQIIEDEVWKFDRKIGGSEAREFAKVAFDDVFDLMQYVAHGD